jgi:hypothetical protein
MRACNSKEFRKPVQKATCKLLISQGTRERLAGFGKELISAHRPLLPNPSS